MTVAVPGFLRRDARPPIEMEAAPAPGTTTASLRPTAIPRRLVRAVAFDHSAPGHDPTDPAVRRFWTAVVGPGAVADLLRLIAATRTGRPLREPLHLGVLAAEGLVMRAGAIVKVRPRVPYLGDRHLRLLHPTLRGEYRRVIEALT